MKDRFKKYLANETRPADTESMLNWLDTEAGKAHMDEWLKEEFAGKESHLQPDAALKEQVFGEMQSRITEDHAPAEAPKLFRRRAFYYSVAASVLALAVLGWIYISNTTKNSGNSATTINTAKERKVIFLPDNSEVVLYENSSLTYNTNWKPGEARTVLLNGEGFFKVQHTKSNSTFTVHTTDSMDVLVLGTSFEISVTGNKSRVILEQGKVDVQINKSLLKKKQVMLPGEMISVNRADSRFENKKVNASLYTGRKKTAFELNHTTFIQLAEMLEDVYGYKVSIPLNIDQQQTFSGSLPNTSVEDILDGISRITSLRHKLEGHNIIFYE